MLAPNSEGNKFVAPNHQSPYYFAPLPSPPGRVQLAGDGQEPSPEEAEDGSGLLLVWAQERRLFEVRMREAQDTLF